MSSANETHYLYNPLQPGSAPTASYTGHACSSFYVKACFSPDGSHILSGSSNKNMYIWQVRVDLSSRDQLGCMPAICHKFLGSFCYTDLCITEQFDSRANAWVSWMSFHWQVAVWCQGRRCPLQFPIASWMSLCLSRYNKVKLQMRFM